MDVDAAHLATKVFATVDELPRDDAFREDSALVIDVGEKKIDRGQPLGETFFKHTPLCGGDEAWQQIVRKNALGTLRVAVDRERDPLGEKRLFGFRLMIAKFRHGSRQKILVERLTLRAGLSSAIEHLVVRGVEEVIGEHPAGRFRGGRSDRSHGRPLEEQKAIRSMCVAWSLRFANFPNGSSGLSAQPHPDSGHAPSTISFDRGKEPTRLLAFVFPGQQVNPKSIVYPAAQTRTARCPCSDA